MNKIVILTFITFITTWVSTSAQGVAAADSAYMAGDYEKAIEIYSTIAKNDGVSAPLLFNTGNAYLKAGDFGRAMLAYQRAKKLDPSNKRIASNINYLREKVEDANKATQKGKKRKVTEDTPNFFQTVHSSIAEDHSSNNWAGWAAAFFILFSGFVALYLFTENVLLRKTGFFGGICALILSIVFLVCAYSAAEASMQNEYGIVVAYKATLQVEPQTKDEENEGEGTLTRGTKVRIIAMETNAEGEVTWYKVRLNSDYIGWMPSNDVEII